MAQLSPPYLEVPIIEGENAAVSPKAYHHRSNVTNLDNQSGTDPQGKARAYFDAGLGLLFGFQHELASHCFLACLNLAPDCVLAYALVSLCHAPNYNFRGEAYYITTDHSEDERQLRLLCSSPTGRGIIPLYPFPCQQVADIYSKLAADKITELSKRRRGGHNGVEPRSMGGMYFPYGALNSEEPSDAEIRLIVAVRTLTCWPGLNPSKSEEIVGRPYIDTMRRIHEQYPNDPDIAYWFAESIMVANAWHLYDYPTGRPIRQDDVTEVKNVLETALSDHPTHVGLCHLHVHLSEMSAVPSSALALSCDPLRDSHMGHLIHMPTHIDVLVGDYEKVVKYNLLAIEADLKSMKYSPATSRRSTFYFGYLVHNYHMAVYGALLGGFERVAMDVARQLKLMVHESLFVEHPSTVAYLEAYSALDIHVLVRFGRWSQILELPMPNDPVLMFFRAASLRFARSLAFANSGDSESAQRELYQLEKFRQDPEASKRILHNNTVEQLLTVDVAMARGEVLYRQFDREEDDPMEGEKYAKAFELLRKAVELQDNLNYDEPWGKMQPIRHALGGLLFEQGHIEEATSVFRKDLEFHPKNPWALVGLIRCLKRKQNSLHNGCCSGGTPASSELDTEISSLEEQLRVQREIQWVDYEITVPCACCQHQTT